MFERFEKDAKTAVIRAQEVCIARGDRMVGAEHLLLAAAESPSPKLRSVGLDSHRVEEAWDRIEHGALKAVGVDLDVAAPWRDRWRRGRRHIPFSGSAKSSLQGALREAIDLGHKRIKVEHLVLGVTVQAPQDRAVRILDRAGLPASELRSALIVELRKAS